MPTALLTALPATEFDGFEPEEPSFTLTVFVDVRLETRFRFMPLRLDLGWAPSSKDRE